MRRLLLLCVGVLWVTAPAYGQTPTLAYSTQANRSDAKPLTDLVYKTVAEAPALCFFLQPLDDATVTRVVWTRRTGEAGPIGRTFNDTAAPWDWTASSTMTTCVKSGDMSGWSSAPSQQVIEALVTLTDTSTVRLTGNIWIAVQPPPKCGNSVIESGETCDDGNTSDDDGCNSLCQVEAVLNPTRVTFGPSPDHDATIPEGYGSYGTPTVSHYLFDAYDADAETPVSVGLWDLGKPTPVEGKCVADITGFVRHLKVGTYFGRVVAVGPGGAAPSGDSNEFKRVPDGPVPQPTPGASTIQ